MNTISAEGPVAAVTTKGLGMGRLARHEALAGYLAIAPWVLGFLLFELGPLLTSLYLSFTKFDVLTTPKWVGLKNWDKMLFNDPLVWHSLKVIVVSGIKGWPPMAVRSGWAGGNWGCRRPTRTAENACRISL